MKDKIVAISGSNSGIGKTTALALAKKGAHIIMICRSQSRGEAAMKEIIAKTNNPRVDLLLCDLASQDSIKELGKNFRSNYHYIDVLINNAGGIFGKRKLNVDGLEYSFALNHMGYFNLTHELLPLLRMGEMKRIVNVSSVAHRYIKKFDWDNIQGERSYSQIYNYGLTKLFNIYFTQALAAQFGHQGIIANSLHPGAVNTGFGKSSKGIFKQLINIGQIFLSSPNKGAKTSVYLASTEAAADANGKYFKNCKTTKPSKLAQETTKQDYLWQISMKLAKITAYGQP